MFARMENGVVAEIFDGSTPVVINGFAIKYRHLETWHQLPSQNFELVARNLVKVAEPALPAHDPLRQRPVRVLCKPGDAAATHSWRLDPRPRAEVVAEIRSRAKNLVLNEIAERTDAAWRTYKDAVRTRGIELVQAFEAGQTVNIETGSANGSGGWPA
jgi:hypothetical protein